MPAEIVNPVPAGAADGWVRAMATTFLNDPRSPATDHWVQRSARDWRPERVWGARDRERWVATLRSDERTLTVPGRHATTGLIDVDAITNVTVAATHRRQRLLSGMLAGALDQARERGDPASVLIAAEWPIYGRFGYAPATIACDYTLHPRRAGGRVAGEVGRVRQVDREEFVALAPSVYERARRRRAGQIDRDQPWWSRTFALDGWPEPGFDLPHNLLVHDGDDGVDGLVAWTTIKDELEPPALGVVAVDGPEAATEAAERDLWAYISGLDLVEHVQLTRRPLDEPVRWLLSDARTLVLTRLEDFMWLKLLDVPAALSARAYGAPGELVLELTDDSPAGVAGRYRLSVAEDGTAVCEPTTAAPDLTLPQTVLASAYLGGFAMTPQRIAGQLVEHRPGAAVRADAMFLTALAPWNTTGF